MVKLLRECYVGKNGKRGSAGFKGAQAGRADRFSGKSPRQYQWTVNEGLMDLQTVIPGGFTLGRALGAAAGVAALLLVVGVLKRLLAKKPESAHHQTVTCRCGWKGTVSSWAGKCPKCSAPLGERKAK